MSRLVALIDQYRDEHGHPSEASVARGMGISPQTISSWRNRPLREPPRGETLRAVARFIGRDYETVVLRAALMDAGLLDEPKPEPPQVTREDGIAEEA